MNNVKFGSSDFNRSQNCSRRLLFVTLMSTVCVIVTADRSIILQNFVKRANQLNHVSSRLASCTATFIKEYFEDEECILLLLSEMLRNSPLDFTGTLMKKLYRTNSVYTLDKRLIHQMATYETTVVIIPLENAIAFEEGDFSFRNYCNGDCNLVIVLTNPFDDEESFLNDTRTLTQGMWIRSIPKLAILASVGDAVLFADILAVRIDRFYAPAKPRLHSRCERDAADTMRWHFNIETESSAVVGSSINAAVFDYFPYTFITNHTGSLTFGGIEGWMLEEIVRSMNVKLNRELISWSNDGTIYRQTYLRLYNATDDLIGGGLFQTHMKMHYTVPYGAVQVAWMIPMVPNVSLRGLITSFNPSVWYALICTLIIGGLVKLFIRDINMLHVAALLLNVSIRQPRRTSSRILFVSWALFGFFITQYYLGSLADQLIKTSDEQIDTMEELFNSELLLGGTEQFVNLLKVSDETDHDDKIVRAIHDKYIIFEHDDFIKQFANLVEGKNTSLALLVMLNLTDIYRKKPSTKTVHVVKEIVGSYPLVFNTWAGFPYLEEFNLKIAAVIQAGLIGVWSRRVVLFGESYYTKSNEINSSDTLDIADIAPAFLLLIIGYCGAFCLLIIEVILYPSRILT